MNMDKKMEIMQLIKEEDVEFIRLQFTDIMGNLKNIAVTPGQMGKVMNNKYTFDGTAFYDDKYYREDEFYLYPDLDTFVILPWRPQQGKVAKIICDLCDADGVPFALSPRQILKKTLERAENMGYTVKVDPECEFFLFHTDENGMPTTITHERAGYMDVGPADFGENARRDMVLTLEQMGFEIESSHHEAAAAQHEIDFKMGEALKIADSLVTFKFAVRSIAKRFGLYATFMPKPRTDLEGSGLHLNIYLYDKDGKNVFHNEDDYTQVSEEAGYFMGGVMAHAKALCAVTNPIVNSYKRILCGEGAPRKIGWSTGGKNPFIYLHRKKFNTKIGLRFPDPSANPYLAIAVCIAAGLDGIEKKMAAGTDYRHDAAHAVELGNLPGTLKDAVKALEKDEILKQALGEEFVEVYSEIKYNEWEDYMKVVSDWEVTEYLHRM